MTTGKVYLVGAGPGDPGLITVKGLECLRRADVIVYDRLVDESILDHADPKAEKIYVGKASSHHTLPQEAINRLLIDKAREGKTVIRLKGGDPFVLGRGGEEADSLRRGRISFEVVPGVSSAVAVPAYAGIPVTHRGVASSFAVVTGHKAFDKSKPEIAWDRLAAGPDTLVILMGMKNLPHVVDQLMKHHKPAATPVAVIIEGTTARQRSVAGTLGDIVKKVRSENLKPPAVVVIGNVVKLRRRLRWFDDRFSPPIEERECHCDRGLDPGTEIPYYPAFLDLHSKKCTVVGGGEVALRKVKMLLDCGADVTVISPTFHPRLRELADTKAVHPIERSYRNGDLKGAAIVIAATDSMRTNRKVAEDALKKKALVNVVDDPAPSDFILPSFFRKGGLTVAVSTGGASPALARKIRTNLERTLGEEYATLLSLIGEVRSALKEKGLKADAETWQEALDLDRLIPLVQSGNLKKVKTILLNRLTSAHRLRN